MGFLPVRDEGGVLGCVAPGVSSVVCDAGEGDSEMGDIELGGGGGGEGRPSESGRGREMKFESTAASGIFAAPLIRSRRRRSYAFWVILRHSNVVPLG